MQETTASFFDVCSTLDLGEYHTKYHVITYYIYG